MELSLHPTSEQSGGVINVSDVVFAAKFNESLIHQVVAAYLAGSHFGTRAQKSRAQVKGTGSKPWRQKGTGRARAGTVKSPLWRGGGVTFAAQSKNHSQKLNKKMYRGALRSILSELIRQKRLLVVEQFTLDAPKTRALVARLQDFNLDNVLIVLEQKDYNVDLAARNLHQVQVTEAMSLNPVSLLKFEKVLLTTATLKKIEERLL